MNKAGFGLLEIVIASAVVGVSIFALSAAAVLSGRLQSQSSDKIRANFLAEEGIEAMRFLRDKNWNTNLAGLSPGTTYYVNFSTTTSQWGISQSAEPYIVSLFERKISVERVYRDINDNIVSSGGAEDADSKKITSAVSWQERGETTSTVSISTYLSDIFNN
ncbi:MAG: hypothetical protein AAB556_01850 [Patescibacteria group bacterium]